MKQVIICLGLLVVIWIVALSTGTLLMNSRPSAEKLIALLENKPLPASKSKDRSKYIDYVVSQINRLDFSQRQKLRASKALENFFSLLDTTERESFIARTLPEGFKQLLNIINNMQPEQRKQLVQQALDELAKSESGGRQTLDPNFDEGFVSRVSAQGLQIYYEEASAETKLDLAPLLERLQDILRSTR